MTHNDERRVRWGPPSSRVASKHPVSRAASKHHARTMEDIMRSSLTMQEKLKFVIQSHQGIAGSNRARDAVIAQKAQEGLEQMRAKEKEYWHWARQLKEQVEPSFRMPADPYLGVEPAEDKIERQARAAQLKMAEITREYEVWLEKIAEEQDERLKEQIRAKHAADLAYASAREAAERERSVRLYRAKKQSKEKADEYRDWLDRTKRNIAARNQSCPPPQRSGAKSVEEYVEEKLAASAAEQRERDAAYSEWLKSVSKPKFKLPCIKCDSVEERDRKIAAEAKKKAAASAKTGEEYRKWLAEQSVKREERLKVKVQAKLAAEAEYMRQREREAAALEEKAAEAHRQREEVAARTANEVEQMYKKVRRRPLMAHETYLPPVWQKTAAPRRLLPSIQSSPAL